MTMRPRRFWPRCWCMRRDGRIGAETTRVSRTDREVRRLMAKTGHRAALADRRASICEPYESDIGRSTAEISTPALTIDLPAARRNLKRMADFLASRPVGLRPHVKAHKSPDAAKLQIAEGGAHGVATATVAEASVMLRSGIDDILIANQVVGEEKLTEIAGLAAEGSITVAVDDLGNIAALGAAARGAGAEVGVLIEYDIGMGRSGARTHVELRRLADAVANTPELLLKGLMAYEGHCMAIEDREMRREAAEAATGILTSAVAQLRKDGHPCAIVSGGGT